MAKLDGPFCRAEEALRHHGKDRTGLPNGLSCNVAVTNRSRKGMKNTS